MNERGENIDATSNADSSSASGESELTSLELAAEETGAMEGSSSVSSSSAGASTSNNNNDDDEGQRQLESARAEHHTNSSPGTDVNKQFVDKYEQLSIELETKLRPDVVEAVLASTSGSPISNVEDNGDDVVEQRDVEESITLSMIIDEKSKRAEVEEDYSPTRSKERNSSSNNNTNTDATTTIIQQQGIENAAADPSEIDDWIERVKQQQRERPSSTVYYEENMPDLQDLMRAWPEEFAEAALKDGTVDPDLDLTLKEYAEVVFALLDVPVYEGSIIQSLHMAMSLYLELEDAEEEGFANGTDVSGREGGGSQF